MLLMVFLMFFGFFKFKYMFILLAVFISFSLVNMLNPGAWYGSNVAFALSQKPTIVYGIEGSVINSSRS